MPYDFVADKIFTERTL